MDDNLVAIPIVTDDEPASDEDTGERSEAAEPPEAANSAQGVDTADAADPRDKADSRATADPPDAADPPNAAGPPDTAESVEAPGYLTVGQLEALLFVAERPLSRREIASLAGIDRGTLDGLLGDLEVALRDRGLRLVSAADEVQLVTAPEAGSLIARYVGASGQKLTPAALETLAIVAYRQPVTRGAIERIRGVDSDYVLRTLVHRRLVVEQGRADTPGRPILYGTGFDFLERFGLTSLDDLPPLEAEAAMRLDE